MDKPCAIYIGFDPREASAFAVARHTINKHLTQPIPVRGIVLSDLVNRGLYTRPMSYQDGQLFDDISGAPCSTQFAISRFFTPLLAGAGWALFLDCDFLVRTNLCRLFEMLQPDKALYCVHHEHNPEEMTKMDGQTQTRYRRKNWSSFMVFNCDHPSNKRLTVRKLNRWPGRDLHAFRWLKDDEIGTLGLQWNWLNNVSTGNVEPKCVHFTLGTPDMQGYGDQPYADEWSEALEDWARGQNGEVRQPRHPTRKRLSSTVSPRARETRLHRSGEANREPVAK